MREPKTAFTKILAAYGILKIGFKVFYALFSQRLLDKLQENIKDLRLLLFILLELWKWIILWKEKKKHTTVAFIKTVGSSISHLKSPGLRDSDSGILAFFLLAHSFKKQFW